MSLWMWARRHKYSTHDVAKALLSPCLLVECVCVLACTWAHTHIVRFAFYSVHSQIRGFITAAWPLVSVPVWPVCVCRHWTVWVWEWEIMMPVRCSCVPDVCVFMYVCPALGGYMCGAVCPQSSPTVTPEAALAQRDTHRERERKRERVPLLSPSHPHTDHFLLICGKQILALFTKLLSASFSLVLPDWSKAQYL